MITIKKNKVKVNYFKKKGFNIIFINSLYSKKDFISLFKRVYKMGYSKAIFETGLTFLNSLLNFTLLNELYIIQNNIFLKKNGLNNSSSKYLKKIKLNKNIKVNLFDDKLYKKVF